MKRNTATQDIYRAKYIIVLAAPETFLRKKFLCTNMHYTVSNVTPKEIIYLLQSLFSAAIIFYVDGSCDATDNEGNSSTD